jgi:hypothetical protein
VRRSYLEETEANSEREGHSIQKSRLFRRLVSKLGRITSLREPEGHEIHGARLAGKMIIVRLVSRSQIIPGRRAPERGRNCVQP